MAKAKTVFFCQNCGAQSPKWVGKCMSCGEWNSYVEEVIESSEKNAKIWTDKETKGVPNKPVKIHEVKTEKSERMGTHDIELDRVLGGGIVAGSLVLVGGEPGIGKSTLFLQMALMMNDRKILYVSGEESPQQIKMRAERMAPLSSDNCFLLAETSVSQIFQQVRQVQPDVLIVDSIQTLYSSKVDSSAGSVSQVRECTGELLQFAKSTDVPVFLIGHITKEGTIAGPKVLEHMVDTVLQFEGDRHLSYRILRTIKNRFGSTSEIGIYEMLGNGMRQVTNPSEILISNKDNELSGVTIGASIEGNRPLLIETQALVSTSAYGTPQRSTTGYDAKRLNMLLAVLEKRGGLRLGNQDVFLNIAGGLKIDDPALDLSICVAVVSSHEEQIVSSDVCFAGEVGLGGEVRAVNRIENRISEAEKLGFSAIYVSAVNKKSLEPAKYKIKIHFVSNIVEVFKSLATLD
ncbi:MULTISPECIES: DNA repair protein RadA [Reichenbachiella]|uniref:DNA repair protein RadA n=1 Tax=Reichenbachiella agariperforans TaxID=156994 RepID=A0A1M6NE88_REIAG|nr:MULTISPECIES: DNA repair protein RadA [Reichenbachiella]MBU2915848.1 DNA repair protein RadA [Reichenbachiella agariperforans]RJE71892.1 DNA repair protein RadA [Reichenbachiella sp. MSK19-1]SHJ94062.1 DNA repair protein RadA/Sms [Reichenbachiella agariperforans]